MERIRVEGIKAEGASQRRPFRRGMMPLFMPLPTRVLLPLFISLRTPFPISLQTPFFLSFQMPFLMSLQGLLNIPFLIRLRSRSVGLL